MATTASVTDALNVIYRLVRTAFEQFHRQEHRFEIRYRYNVLQKRYDKLVHCARRWRRCLLNRLEALGADADSTIGNITVEDDVKRAYDATRDLLARIADAIDNDVDSAVGKSDHVTHKILMRLRCEIEHKLTKVDAWLAPVEDMKANYLVTL
jgi:hypothetical protein